MRATHYFLTVVLTKRGYLTQAMCEKVVKQPEATESQEDGRIRHWARVPELDDRVLRVVTLEDGETLHNAFIDRGFERRAGSDSQ